MIKTLNIAFILLLSVGLGTAEATDTSKKKYPPYPEVWGHILPYPKEGGSIMKLYPSENGDVCIKYISEYHIDRSNPDMLRNYVVKYAYKLFFSKKRSLAPCNEPDKSSENKKTKNKSLKISKLIKFKSGNNIRVKVQRELYCINPFAIYLEKRSHTGEVLTKKSILYKLPKPYIQHLARNCDYGEVGDASAKIEIKSVGGYFILLKDQTFLFYYPTGNFIIRFDQNFNTKFPINRDRVYIIDTEKLNRIMADLDKKYGNDAHKYIFNTVMKELRKQRR